jgi:DNA-binding transcriptional ArsR family regulator
MMDERSTPTAAARALADPLRFAMLVRLLEEPATVADLVAVTGASQSNVSNHLALLRQQRLVRSRRQGRHVAYEIANLSVARLVETLLALSDEADAAPRPPAPIALGRTCYDHLAGVLGVSMFDALVHRGALSRDDPTTGSVRLGAAAKRIFGRLGIDVAAALRPRRKFAYECLDWTERQPHLAGSLGAELGQRFFDAGWVVRGPNSRAVVVTREGRRILHEALGVPSERLEGRAAAGRPSDRGRRS